MTSQDDLSPMHEYDQEAMKRFGSLLYTFRNRKDSHLYQILSQREVSDLIGVGESTFARWENGSARHRPPREYVCRLAEVLRLPTNQTNELLRSLDYYPEYPEGSNTDNTIWPDVVVQTARLLTREEMKNRRFEREQDLIKGILAGSLDVWNTYFNTLERGDIEKKRTQLSNIRRYCSDTSDEVLSWAFQEEADVCIQGAKIPEAKDLLQQAISKRRNLNEKYDLQLREGDLYRDYFGDSRQAEDSYRQVLDALTRRTQDLTMEEKNLFATCLRKLGSVFLFVRGDVELALNSYSNSEKYLTGDYSINAKLLFQQAWAFHLVGRPDKSKQARVKGLNLALRHEDSMLAALGFRLEGDWHYQNSDYEAAIENYDFAEQKAKKITDNLERELEIAKIRRGKGLALAESEPHQAISLFEQSERSLRGRNPLQHGLTLYYYGELLQKPTIIQNRDEAELKFQRAIDIFDRLGNIYYKATARIRLAHLNVERQNFAGANNILEEAEECIILLKDRSEVARPRARLSFLRAQILLIAEGENDVDQVVDFWERGCKSGVETLGLKEIQAELTQQTSELIKRGKRTLAVDLCKQLKLKIRNINSEAMIELIQFLTIHIVYLESHD